MKQHQDIIPFDFLHWNEDEEKWTMLSQEDIFYLLDLCNDSGYSKIEDIMKVVRWGEEAKTAQILLTLVKNKQVAITLKDDDDEVYFKQT